MRELKNVLERALVLAGAPGRIDPIHLQLPGASPTDGAGAIASGPAAMASPMGYAASALPGTWPPPAGSGNDLKAQRESWEKQQILQALEKTSGNQTEAATLLGVSRRTLINKIEAYGIARPRKR